MKTIFFLSIFCITCILPAFSQCLDDQKSLLLGLRNSLIFDLSASTKLVHWNHTKDCCNWDGIQCDVFGHVISLQLDNETISSGIENSEHLFNLSYLEKLNLASNKFKKIQIPKGISNLANLTHLNLSYAGFAGQVPHEVRRLKKLVSLDLSDSYYFSSELKLENPDLKMLVQNLKGLKELYLDSVAISAQGNDWCQAISSTLPDLRILSLRGCNLSGPTDSSLLGLRSLSVLRLDHNDLASAVPDFFANFSRLTTLSLASCSLLGSFPQKIFEIPTLQNLDLSYNFLLSGSFPHVLWEGSLRTMILRGTNFSGPLPDSISNLTMLAVLNLFHCNFFGLLPPTIQNLTELTYFDIADNNFTGSIPLFHLSKKLTHIKAPSNSLTGSLSSMHFEGLLNLEYIHLGQNFLGGNIPPSLFALPSLQQLYLHNNEFHGQIHELSNLSSSLLKELDVSSNNLEGPLPKFFSELEQLQILSLSSNKFNGTVKLEMFKNPSLEMLDLSDNDLFIQSTDNDSILPLLHNIQVLQLASCKLQRFPSLHRQSTLVELDLSSNQLKGEVPNWIWEIGNGSLAYLNLSNNLLHGFQKPYKFPSVRYLDLHSNLFQGELPIPPMFSSYVDYSHNFFTNSIPNDIGVFLSKALFFSASNNNLTGEIPPSICGATYLEVLDLSGNALTGNIPTCLPNKNYSLEVLSLGRNKLSGTIPDTFSVNCNLQTLDLNKNALAGKIPRSLVKCASLEVLNIGNNRIEDTFPCMLMKTNLRVLILRSNQFYGDLQCPKAIQESSNLQIIDISTNKLSGDISLLSFSKWRGMIGASDNKESQYNRYLCVDVTEFSGCRYQDAVTVTIKGLEMELTKILIIFTTIDFSNNKFHGEIPYSIGHLKSLYGLNLSHNELSGPIPASIGNLTQLGSLDLSVNKLTGKIPVGLARLTSISFLNLSHNRLFGNIPEGPQFQTFSAASFDGNLGLYGCPVDTSCIKKGSGVSPPGFQNGEVHLKKEIDWDYVSAALGFALAFGSTVWLTLHCKRWREVFFGKVDQIYLKFFPKC
ncbi:Leucine-rich repeat protein [Handroanthus impetiginosus]|uniref:Leucine-rich repeat protein n=1 Tax=Handroanthus impetiginosus TaxID=429701 RepID=A0A2G9GYA6_9LAMI|nr:Leucine-rich repeat protein [Handroanthus impetiginosus]